MAFMEYAFLIKPCLRALVSFSQDLKVAKGDDGKVDPAEFASAMGNLLVAMWEAGAPLIRDDNKDEE